MERQYIIVEVYDTVLFTSWPESKKRKRRKKR
jgi:hypothetical protein